ncbi:MAG TPA: hypothetical protein VGV61_10745 [Thermoanaerobaculia bacterium]|jgi:hypothetical protein|nr:hypothetical protein [Thermoanaerobaculia bacterium]
MGKPRRRQPRSQGRRSSAGAAWALGLLAFAVYCGNGRRIATNDSLGTSLLPLAVLLDRSLSLDRFGEQLAGATGLYPSRFGLVSSYPIATGVLLAPFYALPVAERAGSHPTADEWLNFAATAEKVAAAAITACAAALFPLLVRRLGASAG